MKRRNWLLTLIMVMSLTIPSAHALMVDVPLETAVEEAELIVQGKISRTWADWNENRDLIHTYVVVLMNDLLKGPGQPINQVTFRFVGGEVGEVGLAESDMPRLEVGEEVIVFLHKRKEKYYRLVGEYQGKYRVEADKLSRKRIVTQAGYSVARKLEKYHVQDSRFPGRVFLTDFKRVVREIVREQQLKQRK